MIPKYVIFSLVILVVLFSSCDSGVAYSSVFRNDSQYDVQLNVFKKNTVNCKYEYFADTFIVKKNSERILAGYNGVGNTSEFSNCATCADSMVLKVVGNSQLKSTVNINDPALWSFKVVTDGYKGGGSCECRFVITTDKIK